MNPSRSIFPLAEAELQDGDLEFIGVNMRLAPEALPPGYASSARNKEFRQRRAATRKGILKLVWSNRVASLTFTADATSDVCTTTLLHGFITGDPVGLANSGGALPGGTNANDVYWVRVTATDKFTLHTSATGAANNTGKADITSAGTGTHYCSILRPLPFNAIYGAGVFRDPDDTEWVILAADDKIYRFRDGMTASVVPVPSGEKVNYPVVFRQAVSDLIMFRGSTRAAWKMSNVDSGFQSITQTSNTIRGASSENSSDGTQQIPNASDGLYFANRLFIPHSRDLVAVSDYLNYTRYQPVRSTFRVQQGTEDQIVALFKFNETTLIVAKGRSIYMVSNIFGNLSSARLDEITREYGCKAAKSFVQVGNDVWFLADRRGVTSITQTELSKLHAVDLPVSDPIQPLIDRIKWDHAHNAVAAYHENKYFLAVPLDAAEVVRSSLITGAPNYDSAGGYSVDVKKDRKYRYTQGNNEKNLAGTLINGTETLSADSDFTAKASTVQLQINTSLLFDNFEGENEGQFAENFGAWTKWTAAVGKIDLIGPGYGWDLYPTEGMYVDLIGTADAVAPTYDGDDATAFESLNAFTLENGKTYKLDYKLAGNQRNAGALKVGVMLGWNSSVTFTGNTTTDELTTGSAHNLSTGDKVALMSSGATDDVLPDGLTVTTLYYARVISATVVTLHPTATDATNNTNKVDITGAGTGTHRLSKVTFHAEHTIGETDPVTAFSSGNITVSTSTAVKIRFQHQPAARQNVGTFLLEVKLYEVGATTAVNASVQPIFTGVNNAILVYDFLNKAWAGSWEGDAILVKDFFKHTYNGVSRLFFTSDDGFINLVEEDFEDQIAESNDKVVDKGISDELVTRGYAVASSDLKRFRRYGVIPRTWAPKFSVTSQFDGVNETKSLETNITKSRTKYLKPFDKADYAVTNNNDDHATAYREDYSVELTDGTTEINPGANGIDPDLHQDFVVHGSIRRVARFCQMKISNTEGRLELQAVQVTASAIARRGGTQG